MNFVALINPRTRRCEGITLPSNLELAQLQHIIVPLDTDVAADAEHLLGRTMPDVYKIAAGAVPFGPYSGVHQDDGA